MLPLSSLTTGHCWTKEKSALIVNLSPSASALSTENSGIHGEEKTEITNSAGSFQRIPGLELTDGLGQIKITFNLPDKDLHSRVEHEHT